MPLAKFSVEDLVCAEPTAEQINSGPEWLAWIKSETDLLLQEREAGNNRSARWDPHIALLRLGRKFFKGLETLPIQEGLSLTAEMLLCYLGVPPRPFQAELESRVKELTDEVRKQMVVRLRSTAGKLLSAAGKIQHDMLPQAVECLGHIDTATERYVSELITPAMIEMLREKVLYNWDRQITKSLANNNHWAIAWSTAIPDFSDVQRRALMGDQAEELYPYIKMLGYLPIINSDVDKRVRNAREIIALWLAAATDQLSLAKTKSERSYEKLSGRFRQTSWQLTAALREKNEFQEPRNAILKRAPALSINAFIKPSRDDE